MKTMYIKIFLLLIYSSFIKAQCTSPLSVNVINTPSGGCIPLNATFINVTQYGAIAGGTVTETYVFGNGSVLTQTYLTSNSATNVSTTYTNVGVYTATLTVQISTATGTCIGTDAGSPISTYNDAGHGCVGVGLNEYYNEKSILIYPNPNNGSFILQINSEIENGKIVLINSFGQKISEEKVINGLNYITTKSLSKGIYNLVISQNDNRIRSTKLVIE